MSDLIWIQTDTDGIPQYFLKKCFEKKKSAVYLGFRVFFREYFINITTVRYPITLLMGRLLIEYIR